MRRLEQVSAVAMLALAGIVLLGTSDLQIWSGITPGARFMPMLIVAATVVLSIALLAQSRGRPATEPAAWPRGDGRWRVLCVGAAIVLFAVAVPWLGFVPTTFLFVVVLLVPVLRQRPLPSLAAAILVPCIVWGLFVAWLGIRLPRGILGF